MKIYNASSISEEDRLIALTLCDKYKISRDQTAEIRVNENTVVFRITTNLPWIFNYYNRKLVGPDVEYTELTFNKIED